jgi:hypothetical protein
MAKGFIAGDDIVESYAIPWRQTMIHVMTCTECLTAHFHPGDTCRMAPDV